MKKKLYSKPEIEFISIDNNISMVMMTDYSNPPDIPEGEGVAAQSSGQTEAASTYENPLEKNPFE